MGSVKLLNKRLPVLVVAGFESWGRVWAENPLKKLDRPMGGVSNEDDKNGTDE